MNEVQVPTTALKPILQMRGITKHFPPIIALSGVDLDVYPGEVHALMGENGAGKSTLMKILSGAHSLTRGMILIDGAEIEIKGPQHAKALGISIIYQELSLAPNLTVAENMLLGREITRFGLLNRVAMNRRCAGILEQLGVDFGASDKVSSLSLAQRQQVEIAGALLADCRILVMDEPTTSLSSKECENLFRLIGRLKQTGMAIIYISHRMDEIYALSDRVSVLRDGKFVGCVERRELSEQRLVQMMVGRDLSSFYQKDRSQVAPAKAIVLSVRSLGDGVRVKDANLDLHEGEVLGIAGIVGAGRTELARLIYGVDQKTTGQITLGGQQIKVQSPLDAIDAGIVYLTEDRKGQGLFLDMSVSANVNISTLERDGRGLGILNGAKAKLRTAEAIASMRIAVRDGDTKVGTLSGGNQQKVLLARLLQTNPKVLILDEPTRGVDIGAKSEIYRLIEDLASKGTAIIVISSELPELIGISDRIMVMREGRIVGGVGGAEGATIDSEAIIALATGSHANNE
ncbi:sugar ABC transporter ATP-binding protein [Devosia sp. 2618]|uniref:sugar ABC transporter ATP-binding protein n=1 Tax=Devosia sp. 2618 TaxID=3156454 RepID=UPI003399C1D5